MNKSDLIDGIIRATFDIGRLVKHHTMCGDCNDIHMGQLHALGYIKSKKGITMKELAELMMITSPSATSFIDRLVALGYVRRLRDKKNRTLVRLTITATGLKILEKKTVEKKAMFSQIFQPLSETDQKNLLKILGKVLQH